MALIILVLLNIFVQAIPPLETHLAVIHADLSKIKTKLQSDPPVEAHLSSIHSTLSEMQGYAIIGAKSLQTILTVQQQADEEMQMIQHSMKNLLAQVANLDISAQQNVKAIQTLADQTAQIAKNQSNTAEIISNNSEVLSGINAGINEGMLTQATAIYGTITVVVLVLSIFIFLLFSSYRIAARDIVRQVSYSISSMFNPTPQPQPSQAPSVPVPPTDLTVTPLPPSYSSVNLSVI